ncbi:MAG: helix-turn-helix transcriptional regulator [Acidimicrobiaceae bacterium]|nr:helix-turn-helix transcriptional regulator [Acidimicrobiaceae bacterium]
MPNYRRALRKPKLHLAPNEIWPNGKLDATAPPEAHLAKALAQRFHSARARHTLKQIADQADISTDSLSRLLRGETWGTIPVIAQLETALDTDLWGDEHRQHTKQRSPR